MAKKRQTRQLVMAFGWGGWRPGAGRKPSNRRDKRELHRRRPEISRRSPAHVILKVRPEFYSLRTKARVEVIRRAFLAACAGDGFRIIDWSIQRTHLHLIVEADSSPQLSRGMQGFSVRVAHGLNGLTGRKGPVFTERYHVRLLETPAETRSARAYVVNNFRRHAAANRRHVDVEWIDPCSSWAWFDGWRALPSTHADLAAQLRADPAPVAKPESWLIRVGWRRHGLVRVDELPAECNR